MASPLGCPFLTVSKEKIVVFERSASQTSPCSGITLVACQSRLLGPTPRGSDSIGMGWDPRMCIYNKLPSIADAAGSETSLRPTGVVHYLG